MNAGKVKPAVYERRVAIRSAKSLHARPVALLVAYLLKVPPGTRFVFAGYRGTGLTWSVEDFGKAHAARPPCTCWIRQRPSSGVHMGRTFEADKKARQERQEIEARERQERWE